MNRILSHFAPTDRLEMAGLESPFERFLTSSFCLAFRLWDALDVVASRALPSPTRALRPALGG